ncbi:hypothetical protein L484_008480 [Morus notabilis]|uniref:Uncharacterized protein n=1 Tax=Morus notabilis TaxID=981085 RepID=W9SHI7_9ROSA|nr:hypothetical protein L484_008480 [Morus notabilis]
MPSSDNHPLRPDQPIELMDFDLFYGVQGDLETLPPYHLCFINNLREYVASLEYDILNVRQSRDALYYEYHTLRHQNYDKVQEMESMKLLSLLMLNLTRILTYYHASDTDVHGGPLWMAYSDLSRSPLPRSPLSQRGPEEGHALIPIVIILG